MTTAIIILVIIAVIVWGLRGIVRWWNLPHVVEARTARRKLIQENGLFGWRKRRRKP